MERFSLNSSMFVSGLYTSAVGVLVVHSGLFPFPLLYFYIYILCCSCVGCGMIKDPNERLDEQKAQKVVGWFGRLVVVQLR
jgi:hypothetical protein